MLFEYQLKVANLYNVAIDKVKKISDDEEKYVLHYENLQLYLRLGLKLKEYIAH